VYSHPTTTTPSYVLRGRHIHSLRIPQGRGTIDLAEDAVLFVLARQSQTLQELPPKDGYISSLQDSLIRFGSLKPPAVKGSFKSNSFMDASRIFPWIQSALPGQTTRGFSITLLPKAALSFKLASRPFSWRKPNGRSTCPATSNSPGLKSRTLREHARKPAYFGGLPIAR
jgi:hypothetical protein